jgi:ribosomal subunit interface protein
MTLRVSGKNLDIGESLRTYVGARLSGVVSKYSAEPADGHVTVDREGSGFRTDCTLHLDSGIVLQVEADAQDAYASFNKVADRIEKRLRRLKRRLRDRGYNNSQSLRTDQGNATLEPGASFDHVFEESRRAEEMTPLVIAEPPASLRELSVSGAVRELDVSDAPCIVFRHAGDGHTNVVYRRADGNIGWIDAAFSSASEGSVS